MDCSSDMMILYNKCEWFRNAVNSVINFFKETLTAVGSVAKSVFEGIGNVIGSVMDAAKATVSEKLSNIKTAYEEHGGGISGVAAAAMEAVKGWYTAGYAAANEDGEPGDDEDAVPAPA